MASQKSKARSATAAALAEATPPAAAAVTTAPASADACLNSAPTLCGAAVASNSIIGAAADSPNGASVAALTTTIENGNSSPSGSPAKSAAEPPQKVAKVFQYQPSRSAVTPVELTWKVALTDKFHQKHKTAGDVLISAPTDPMKVVFMFPHDGTNKPHKLCAWGQKSGLILLKYWGSAQTDTARLAAAGLARKFEQKNFQGALRVGDVFHVTQLAPSAIEPIKSAEWSISLLPEYVTHSLNLSRTIVAMCEPETLIHVEFAQVQKHFECGWLCDVCGVLIELCKMKQHAVIKNKHGEQLTLRVCDGLVNALTSHEGTEFVFGHCEVLVNKNGEKDLELREADQRIHDHLVPVVHPVQE